MSEKFPSTSVSEVEKTPEQIKMSSETIDRTPPEADGTVIIMQRHGLYNKKEGTSGVGHLTETGRIDSLARARSILTDMLESIPSEERSTVKIAVVASPTELEGGQRSIETAEAVLESAREVFSEYKLPAENILSQTPRPVETIEQPRIFKDESPGGFRAYLEEMYGHQTQEFWAAFEDDRHQDKRLELGAEGPLEMSDRYAHFTNVLGRFARMYHHQHPGERLVIWDVSHYDTITTFFKNHVAGIPQEEFVPVDYDGGLSVAIDPEDQASIKMNGKEYPIELATRGNKLARHKTDTSSSEV